MNNNTNTRIEKPKIAAFAALTTIIWGTTSGVIDCGLNVVAIFRHESYLLVLMPIAGEAIAFWMLYYQMRLYSKVYDCFRQRTLLNSSMALLGSAGVAEFVLSGVSHKKVFAEFQDTIASLGMALFYVNVLIFVVLVCFFAISRRKEE
jgi:hypothetical protein